MVKVGIITHYYKSTNYGGNLQAYALCKALKNIGIESEQICYPVEDKNVNKKWEKEESSNIIKKYIKMGLRKSKDVRRLLYMLFKHNEYLKFKQNIKTQESAFTDFNSNMIPHSSKVYDNNCFKECVDCYDAFITGSDQVWNFSWFQPEYFLESVPSEKIKIAYAASMGICKLNANQKQYIMKVLDSFDGISVRESNTATYISQIINKDVMNTVDPTLLIEATDWNRICSDRIVKTPYVFCYFLGDNTASRNLSRKFAMEKGLTLVIIPMLHDGVHFIDDVLGDTVIYNATPYDFLSLIKNADYIFTDSYHATIFSYLFKKEMFIFNRNIQGVMKDRISSLVNLLNISERYCCDNYKLSLEYIKSVKLIDYADNSNLNMEILKSYNFLELLLKSSTTKKLYI